MGIFLLARFILVTVICSIDTTHTSFFISFFAQWILIRIVLKISTEITAVLVKDKTLLTVQTLTLVANFGTQKINLPAILSNEKIASIARLACTCLAIICATAIGDWHTLPSVLGIESIIAAKT